MPIQLSATNRLHHRPPCSLNNEYWLSVYQITTNNIYCRRKCQNMRKNMRYAHFAKICEKCGKVPMPNMRQSHIRVFLTCLISDLWHLWVSVFFLSFFFCFLSHLPRSRFLTYWAIYVPQRAFPAKDVPFWGLDNIRLHLGGQTSKNPPHWWCLWLITECCSSLLRIQSKVALILYHPVQRKTRRIPTWCVH